MERLDTLLNADLPEPSSHFDARFWTRFAQEADTDAAVLDGLLGVDAPEPSIGFDAVFRCRFAQRATPWRWRRPATMGLALVGMAAAAVMFLLLPAEIPAPVVPTVDPAMVAELELLELYDELQVLDALEDAETFELIAALHTLPSEDEASP